MIYFHPSEATSPSRGTLAVRYSIGVTVLITVGKMRGRRMIRPPGPEYTVYDCSFSPDTTRRMPTWDLIERVSYKESDYINYVPGASHCEENNVCTYIGFKLKQILSE